MSGHAIERSEICAVVVTYFPKPSCVDNLAAILSQVGKLLVVDKGSSAEAFAPVEEAGRRLGVTIVRLGANLGIATALNTGLKFARDHGFRWLATFDQDSQPTPGMIEAMAAAFAAFPRPETIAIITPCHVDRRLGVRVRERGSEDSGEGWRIIPSTMTSGNLVAVEIALGVGGFDDSLFIDYVDHEFCLRLRRHGYRVLEALRARLLHQLGAMERRWFIFKHVTITNHPVLRRYYSSRNRLIVWRGYWRYAPVWVIRDMRRFAFETLYIVLYEQQSQAKFAAIVRGLRDGIRNVRGEFRPASQ